jgi:hypothetical protein
VTSFQCSVWWSEGIIPEGERKDDSAGGEAVVCGGVKWIREDGFDFEGLEYTLASSNMSIRLLS